MFSSLDITEALRQAARSENYFEIAKIFDLLGLIAPIKFTLKMLMQATWVKGLQWDDTLPVDLEETWQAAHEQLN